MQHGLDSSADVARAPSMRKPSGVWYANDKLNG